MSGNKPISLYASIYALVKQIPAGHVCSYGQIGQVIGCSARTVGFAMAALPAGNDVPWQRIVNSQGMVSPRADGDTHLLQRALLESEGVSFDGENRIDLSRHSWTFSF